jgi:hypothetical protein
MTLLPEFLRTAGTLEPIITTVIIILVLMFLPGGIIGSQDRQLLVALRWVRRRVPGVRGGPEPATAGSGVLEKEGTE